MLVPVRISGSKPPLFFVHDQYGIMPFGRSFAQVSGPDQPFYVINANGIDGRSPVIHDVQAMVLAYIAEIHGARPMGPLLIGGLGSGGLLAIEIARELQERGRQIGPVILADPPRPAGPVQESRAIDSRWPAIGGHFYHPVRTALLAQASRSDSDLPFDSGDPKQLHLATLAGVATLVAFTKYAPKPFSGAAELLLPVERPEEFFDTHGPWHELLDGECIVHVLPWNHDELLRSGRQTVLYTLKFLVEEAIEAIAPGEAIDAPASGRSWFASDKPHAGANRNPNSVLVVNENWDLHWRDPPYLPR